MNPVELERRLQRIERELEELASAGRPRIRVASWTPDLYGSTTYGTTTYSIRQGRYVLLNHVCLVWISLMWSSTTASGLLRVTLPFASTSTWYEPVIPIRHADFSYPSGVTLYATMVLGGAYLVITDSITSTQINVPASGYLGFSGMYWIAP